VKTGPQSKERTYRLKVLENRGLRRPFRHDRECNKMIKNCLLRLFIILALLFTGYCHHDEYT
jgi:hypothetical protein